MFETEGDGLLTVGELAADGVRDRWSRWILVTSLGWNGFRHIGQTRRVKDLRHLRLDQSQYGTGRGTSSIGRDGWLETDLPQTKHVSTSGGMGSSVLTVQDELFQTNVTARFRIDDKHDPEEGKVKRTIDEGGLEGRWVIGTTGPELQGEKPQGSRCATVFKRREDASVRSRFYNVFVIGIVRPRVRLRAD